MRFAIPGIDMLPHGRRVLLAHDRETQLQREGSGASGLRSAVLTLTSERPYIRTFNHRLSLGEPRRGLCRLRQE